MDFDSSQECQYSASTDLTLTSGFNNNFYVGIKLTSSVMFRCSQLMKPCNIGRVQAVSGDQHLCKNSAQL